MPTKPKIQDQSLHFTGTLYKFTRDEAKATVKKDVLKKNSKKIVKEKINADTISVKKKKVNKKGDEPTQELVFALIHELFYVSVMVWK
jgi:hypothetical protein